MNRMGKYSGTSEIAEAFSSYSFSKNMFTTTIPEYKVEDVIDQYIRGKVDKAKKEGEKQAVAKIIKELREYADRYVLLVTKIADVVCEASDKRFKETSLRIADVRTNLHLDTRAINILFVIDADLESEIEFSKLLSELKLAVFQEDRYLSELFYLNKRDTAIDDDSVNYDYPLYRSDKKIGK